MESDALNVLENSLRDLIERLLGSADGDDAAARLGVSDERLDEWRSRREEEAKRRVGGEVEDRLLYFSDFTDLVKIIDKNWATHFKDCFGNRKRFDVYMDRLGAFRNPNAHSRSLLPHEEHLCEGMAGELRQEVTLYLSSGAGGGEPEYFARIEEVRDNFGLRAVGEATNDGAVAPSGVTLRPGDVVSFTGRAWDPDGGDLVWTVGPLGTGTEVTLHGSEIKWEWEVRERDIADFALVLFKIRSKRPYARSIDHDDKAFIRYRVLPPRP